MKGGNCIEAKKSSEDMYASIDLVSHMLFQSLKKVRRLCVCVCLCVFVCVCVECVCVCVLHVCVRIVRLCT